MATGSALKGVIDGEDAVVDVWFTSATIDRGSAPTHGSRTTLGRRCL